MFQERKKNIKNAFYTSKWPSAPGPPRSLEVNEGVPVKTKKFRGRTCGGGDDVSFIEDKRDVQAIERLLLFAEAFHRLREGGVWKERDC